MTLWKDDPRAYQREWYRKKHLVHPTNYLVGRRRLCRECWDELTEASAARHRETGRPVSWCTSCYPLHLRRRWKAARRSWRRRQGIRPRKAA